MGGPAATLCAEERDIVLASVHFVSEYEGWTIYAAHIRSTHVHIVVYAAAEPEKVLGKFKAYSSRALNQRFGGQVKRWSRHGSTVYLWDTHQLAGAIDYVVHGQGPAMSCYLNPSPAKTQA